ncbi:MAG: serine/threonine-protein kinase [Pirellulales bacterium]
MNAPAEPSRHPSLAALLSADLATEIPAQVAEHVADCPWCRQQLETLAADDPWWRDTRQVLHGLTADAPSFSEYLVDRADSPHDLTNDAVVPPLSFLAASDNPAMLGRLGEFEILEAIGCGGMGIVLKGYDHQLNRFVAVKVLHPHSALSAAARRRFVREAQAAAAVVHPHVIAIHEVDAQHDPPYLVMPFIPGESLQQRLDRLGPLPIVDVLRIGQQVAEGLAAAHAQGLVHRDIKPANILLERNVDRVTITDFGLARAADDASLTRSGVIAGTPQFMSPEQARGEPVDPRTDLFSLGALLYTLLAGHSPFRAPSPLSVLRRVTDDTPRRLREINADVPEWFEKLLDRLLAKAPADRWESASQVADLLRRCLAHVQHPTDFALPLEVSLPPRATLRFGALYQRATRPFRGWRPLVLTIGALAVAGVWWAADLLPGWGLTSSQDSPPIVLPSPSGHSEVSGHRESPAPDSAPSRAPMEEPRVTTAVLGAIRWHDGFERQLANLRRDVERLEQDLGPSATGD